MLYLSLESQIKLNTPLVMNWLVHFWQEVIRTLTWESWIRKLGILGVLFPSSPNVKAIIMAAKRFVIE